MSPSGSLYPPEPAQAASGAIGGLGPRCPRKDRREELCIINDTPCVGSRGDHLPLQEVRRAAPSGVPPALNRKGCELMIETDGFKQDLIAIRKMIAEAGDSL